MCVIFCWLDRSHLLQIICGMTFLHDSRAPRTCDTPVIAFRALRDPRCLFALLRMDIHTGILSDCLFHTLLQPQRSSALSIEWMSGAFEFFVMQSRTTIAILLLENISLFFYYSRCCSFFILLRLCII